MSMRCNPYKVFVPFLATFLVSVSFVLMLSYFETKVDFATKQKIYAVLAKDAQNRQDRLNKNSKVKLDNDRNGVEGDDFIAIKGIVDQSKSTAEIDVSELPADFQDSWKKYVNAQAERAAVLNNLANRKLFILNNDNSKEWNRTASNEIKAWSEIVKISKVYGLKFDPVENFTVEN